MITLRHFEESLHREFPAFHWHCHPASPTKFLPGSDVPQDIEISATREGGLPAGGPWHLSGNLLLLWGQDSAARLFCKELAHPRRAGGHEESTWDKLAEI
jgi:hypothetical protein